MLMTLMYLVMEKYLEVLENSWKRHEKPGSENLYEPCKKEIALDCFFKVVFFFLSTTSEGTLVFQAAKKSTMWSTINEGVYMSVFFVSINLFCPDQTSNK